MTEKKDAIRQELLRKIPSVDKILDREYVTPLCTKYSRSMVLKALQNRLDKIRTRIIDSNIPLDDFEHIISVTSEDIEEEIVLLVTPRLKKVINATGVILHTNLGRSLLPQEVLNHLVTIADSYSNLEYDVEEGSRGSRYSHVEELLCDITGAESAFVVNNNAAAVVLVLNTLAQGRETIVSRGELI